VVEAKLQTGALRRLAVLGAFAAFLGCGPSGPVKVLVIGDSMSVPGQSFVTGNVAGPSYVDALSALLGESYEVVSVACAGASAIDWSTSKPGTLCGTDDVGFVPHGLYRDRALPKLPADVALVLLGTNDAMGYMESGGRVDTRSFHRAIEEILDALDTAGVDEVVLAIPPDSVRSDYHERLVEYRAVLQSLCAERSNVTCGPDFFAVLDPVWHFPDSDVHPNTEGHRQMAEAFAASLRQLR
jgi:lysophospholipase L1-like esterase